MKTNQNSYTVFMESVCSQFNCPEALPALKEGFKAFCEAFDNRTGNLQRFTGSVVYVDQANFSTKTPLAELTTEEVEQYLDDWTPVTSDGTAKDAFEAFKDRRQGGRIERVIVNNPNKCIWITSFGDNGDGTYHAHAYGTKIMNKAGESVDDDYMWNLKPETRSLIRNDRRNMHRKNDDAERNRQRDIDNAVAWGSMVLRMHRFLEKKGLLDEFENSIHGNRSRRARF